MLKKFIAAICMTLILTGCSVKVQRENVAPESDFVLIEDNISGFNSYCHYVIHKPTNVVYLSYGGSEGGITVMLNPDGTPITADQLGISIED